MYVIILCLVAGQAEPSPHAAAAPLVSVTAGASTRLRVHRPPVAATNAEATEPEATRSATASLDGAMPAVLPSREPADRGTTTLSDADEAAMPETPAWLTPTEEQAASEPMDLNGLAFKMFIATVCVLAAAVASIFLGRQWLEQRRPAEPLGRQVRVLETKSLSPRASLQLVDAAGQMVLVGVDSQGIKGMVRLTGAFEDVWQDANEAAPEEA